MAKKRKSKKRAKRSTTDPSVVVKRLLSQDVRESARIGLAQGVFAGEAVDSLSTQKKIDAALYILESLDDAKRDFFLALEQTLANGKFRDAESGELISIEDDGDRWSSVMATVVRHFGPDPKMMLLTQLIMSIGEDKIADALARRFKPLDPGKQAVKDYLWAIEKCFEGSTMGPEALRGFGTADWERGVRLCRALWVHLREARVFEVDFEDFGHMVNQGTSDWMTASGFGTYTDNYYDGGKGQVKLSEDDFRAGWDLTREHTQTIDFPVEKLPFEWVFIGVSSSLSGWSWGSYLKTERLPPGLDSHAVLRLRLVGYLVSEMSAVEILAVHRAGEDPFMLPNTVWTKDEGWVDPTTLNQFWLPGIVERIEDHRTFTEHKPTFGVRRRFKDMARITGTRFLPQPYYTIQLDPTRIIRDEQKREPEGPGRELSYRYDRSAHERCYVRRGPLPLPVKEAEKLRKYGYRIYTLTSPSADDAHRLAIRDMKPKGPREWVAIKHRNISHTVVGPDNLPYIPAVRVSA